MTDTPLVLTMVNAEGEQYEGHFHSEDDVVSFLRSTWTTATPLSVRKSDGSPISRETMERLRANLFTELTKRAGKLRALLHQTSPPAI